MTIKEINKRLSEIEATMEADGCTDATAHPLWNEYENLLGALASREILKRELLKMYSEIVSHGYPALRAATPDKQLKMYPIMQFIREICFYA